MSSIRGRLTLGLAGVCVALWAAGGAALYLTLRSGLSAEFDQALQASAQALAMQTERSEGQVKFDTADELMPAFERAERPDYFQASLAGGSILARSPSLGEGSLPGRGGTLAVPESWNLLLPDGARGRAIGLRFLPKQDEDDSGGPVPPGPGDEVLLVVARHRSDLDRRLGQLLGALLLVGASTAAAATVVVVLAVRSGLRPLSRLAEHAASIDASSLQRRFPTDRMPAELAPIAQRLNDLLARLEASFERERRFSADVAHELRTPIAELRTLAEVSLTWPEDGDGVRSSLQEVRAIALQMEAIATGLLALTRCEGGLLALRPGPVGIGPLVEEAWKPLADQARAKRLSVTRSVPEGATWRTDPVALRAILANLLSNAVEYCPAAGTVRLRVEGGEGCGHLLISNTTEHLVPGDLPHLFERFWRKDPSRSSSEHCGLGLALARGYAESLGLRLEAALSDSAELTIELSRAACRCQPGRLAASPSHS